jgi:hypothetical protein
MSQNDDEVLASLTPAEHVVDPPSGGWSAADLSEDELVDDAFIEADPTSVAIRPFGVPDGA